MSEYGRIQVAGIQRCGVKVVKVVKADISSALKNVDKLKIIKNIQMTSNDLSSLVQTKPSLRAFTSLHDRFAACHSCRNQLLVPFTLVLRAHLAEKSACANLCNKFNKLQCIQDFGFPTLRLLL
jgi:hypothetical protein